MSAPVLKCSHILTNRQRREIITYKNEAARDHLIRVIRLSLAVRISGSGGIIGHLSENSKGFLMEVPGMPDFVGIKSYLNRALLFATTQSFRQTAEARINQIDRMILFYKADVATTKGTRAGLEAALGYLDEVAKLNPDDIETELIKKKKASIRELLKTL